jgi:hypothetical protein
MERKKVILKGDGILKNGKSLSGMLDDGTSLT